MDSFAYDSLSVWSVSTWTTASISTLPPLTDGPFTTSYEILAPVGYLRKQNNLPVLLAPHLPTSPLHQPYESQRFLPEVQQRRRHFYHDSRVQWSDKLFQLLSGLSSHMQPSSPAVTAIYAVLTMRAWSFAKQADLSTAVAIGRAR